MYEFFLLVIVYLISGFGLYRVLTDISGEMAHSWHLKLIMVFLWPVWLWAAAFYTDKP